MTRRNPTPLASRPFKSESQEQQFGALLTCIESQHCISVWFVGVAIPPVTCSNTGLKMRNKLCEILMQPSNAPNCCSHHSDLKGLLASINALCHFPVWRILILVMILSEVGCRRKNELWWRGCYSLRRNAPSPAADIFSLKYESSIFRSVIQPCMWFLHDGTG